MIHRFVSLVILRRVLCAEGSMDLSAAGMARQNYIDPALLESAAQDNKNLPKTTLAAITDRPPLKHSRASLDGQPRAAVPT
jgi:hypothetical protein